MGVIRIISIAYWHLYLLEPLLKQPLHFNATEMYNLVVLNVPIICEVTNEILLIVVYHEVETISGK